jgi:hypothetical protein
VQLKDDLVSIREGLNVEDLAGWGKRTHGGDIPEVSVVVEAGVDDTVFCQWKSPEFRN